jgi:hypothetical protein
LRILEFVGPASLTRPGSRIASDCIYQLQKRLRSARTSKIPGAQSAVVPKVVEPAPPSESEILEELASLEVRVEEFLHVLQGELKQAAGLMLESVMSYHLMEASAIRDRIPAVQETAEINENLAGHIADMTRLG